MAGTNAISGLPQTDYYAPAFKIVVEGKDLKPETLKEGYDRAYRDFYRWSSIARASRSHGTIKHQAKHFFYAAGWKKFEPLWDVAIRARQLRCMTPVLEAVLSRLTSGQAEDEQRVTGGDRHVLLAVDRE